MEKDIIMLEIGGTELELVSVAIICYKQEKYIADTIQSVMNQTYKRIELIVVDDCSPDQTFEIAKSIVKQNKGKFERVVLHRNEFNTGNVSKNANIAFSYARGTYFKLLGGDDLLLPDFCTATVQVLSDSPECDAVFTDMYCVDSEFRINEQINVDDRFITETIPENIDLLFMRLMRGNILPAPSQLLRSNMVKELNGYNEDNQYEDYDFWLKMCRNKKKIKVIYQPYVLYRRSANSLTSYSGERALEKFNIAFKNAVYEMDLNMKYISDPIEKMCIWDCQMAELSTICVQQSLTEGLQMLESFVHERGFNFSPQKFADNEYWISTSLLWDSVESEVAFKNYLRKYKINKIAVYGYGYYGRRVVSFLSKIGIEPQFIIDKRGQDLTEDYRVLTMDEEWDEVDGIIVTMNRPSQKLINDIYKKSQVNVIKRQAIVEEVLRNS